MHQIKKKMKRINLESKLIDNSIISYEQARKSPALFHLLSSVLVTLCQKQRQESWKLPPGASIIFMVVQE